MPFSLGIWQCLILFKNDKTELSLYAIGKEKQNAEFSRVYGFRIGCILIVDVEGPQ